MRPCRNCSGGGQRVQNTGAMQNAVVNRYSHPIRVKSDAGTSSEELLSYILETLSHHGDLLEELLRRTEKTDTM